MRYGESTVNRVAWHVVNEVSRQQKWAWQEKREEQDKREQKEIQKSKEKSCLAPRRIRGERHGTVGTVAANQMSSTPAGYHVRTTVFHGARRDGPRVGKPILMKYRRHRRRGRRPQRPNVCKTVKCQTRPRATARQHEHTQKNDAPRPSRFYLFIHPVRHLLVGGAEGGGCPRTKAEARSLKTTLRLNGVSHGGVLPLH